MPVLDAKPIQFGPLEICKKLCPDATIILDCGAGKGFCASEFRRAYPDARILSCEPTTACFNALAAEVEGLNIECRKFAVSDTNGKSSINLTANDESSSFLDYCRESELWREHLPVGSEQCEVKTIDKWLSEEGIAPQDVSILKLDVQGSELLALKGAERLLECVKVVVCEVWHKPGYSNCPMESDVTAYMRSKGFRGVCLSSHPSGIWSDAIYSRDRKGMAGAAVRLNIGAGDTVIPGFTAIDRKLGTEAFPLPQYADNSVEEIRCSHMLEHLSFQDALTAMKEWNRVLRPGGRLRIAVPDVRKIMLTMGQDDQWRFYLMGGQTDSDNFHRSAFDEGLLLRYFENCGFENIQKWESPNTDTASHPISLNIEGYKSQSSQADVLKIRAIMSVPRIGWNDAWMSINRALEPLHIPVETFNGVFWGQCMQRAFEKALVDGIDWLLCIDYDSMITAQHVDALLGHFGQNPEIDALAALQCRRGNEETPLMTVCGKTGISIDGSPVKVTTAHFGLTLIRTECLRDVPKPWFKSEPDSKGEYGKDRLDDDIWFWHQWRLAGKSIYVAPDVRIGHLQLMVSEFDEHMQPRHVHVTDWRKQ